MLKKAKVVMLATNQLTKISLFNGKLSKDFTNESLFSDKIVSEFQNLYIISIENTILSDEGYVYVKDLNIIEKNNFKKIGDLYKEVIAITDTSLKINGKLNVFNRNDKYLPQPSDSFVDKYIESYNQRKIITDVLVEYEHFDEFGDLVNDNYIRKSDKFKLKISKNNTITIKEDWNKQDIKFIITEFAYHSRLKQINTNNDICNDFDEWIGNNL